MKTFDEIDDEIREVFAEGTKFGYDETKDTLSKIVGSECSCYDVRIDDGCSNDEKDAYIMCACFNFKDSSIIVRIYFGDETLIIGDVDITE